MASTNIYKRIDDMVSFAWGDADKYDIPMTSIVGGEILYRFILYSVCAFYYYDNNDIHNGDSMGEDIDRLIESTCVLNFDWSTIGRLHYIYTSATHYDGHYHSDVATGIDNFINANEGLTCVRNYSEILSRMSDGVIDLIECLRTIENEKA